MESSGLSVVRLGMQGRDEILIEPVADKSGIGTRIQVIGCSRFLQIFGQWRAAQTQRDPQAWSLPQGDDHGTLLLREAILRYRGEWTLPYQEEEICHCRRVSTQAVQDAIRNGAHDLERIRRITAANTSCGSCRGDIEDVLAYQLGVYEKSSRK